MDTRDGGEAKDVQDVKVGLDSWLTRESSARMRYGAAILAVGFGMLIDEADLLSGGFRIYLVYYPVIVVASLYGGFGPGLLAIVLSAVSAAFFLVEPVGHLAIAARADRISMIVFILGSLFVVWVCTRLRWALKRAAQAEARTETAAELDRKAQLLKESEQRLSMAQKAGQVGVFDWDITHDIVIWTSEQEELFGIPSGEFEGTYTSWLKHLHPEDKAPLTLFLEEWMQSGREKERWEYRIMRSDGEIRWIAAQGILFRDAEGQAVRMIGSNRDITDRKRTEETLRNDLIARDIKEFKGIESEQERLLEASKTAKDLADNFNRAKERFTAVLSEELRTLLTPVLATVTSLERQSARPADLQEDIELLQHSVELGVALVDDLLDATTANRGKTVMHPVTVDADACLQTALRICREEIDAKHLIISLGLQDTHHHVWADPTRLMQVFWILLKNAVKFTPNGGRISLRSTNDNGNWKVQVSDSGIGISPEVLPRIFEVDEHEEEDTTRSSGNSRQGLSIAKAIVETHSGNLTVSSMGEDKGVTFSVELATVLEAPTSPPSPTVPAPSAEQPRKILLVDDHPDTLLTLSKLLRKWGYVVETAECVRVALERAAREPFDALVSDVGLPDGTGMEIMRRLKELYGIRGIALSGYGTEEDIRESREAGFSEHLIKPVSFGALRSSLEEVLSNGGKSQPNQPSR